MFSASVIAILTVTFSAVEASVPQCPYWCDAGTCGQDVCASCPACAPVSSGGHCANWCSVYTCDLTFAGEFCEGCQVCGTLAAGAHCASWCNFFTCFSDYCSGCVSCRAPWHLPNEWLDRTGLEALTITGSVPATTIRIESASDIVGEYGSWDLYEVVFFGPDAEASASISYTISAAAPGHRVGYMAEQANDGDGDSYFFGSITSLCCEGEALVNGGQFLVADFGATRQVSAVCFFQGGGNYALTAIRTQVDGNDAVLHSIPNPEANDGTACFRLYA